MMGLKLADELRLMPVILNWNAADGKYDKIIHPDFASEWQKRPGISSDEADDWRGAGDLNTFGVLLGKYDADCYLVCIDIDRWEEGQPWLAKFDWPPTLETESVSSKPGAQRFHRWFWTDRPLPKTVWPGGELLSGALAGSYVCLRRGEKGSFEHYDLSKIAMLPDEVADAWQAKPGKGHIKSVPSAGGSVINLAVVKNQRNLTMSPYCYRLIKQGLDDADVIAAMRGENLSYEPPLDDAELLDIFAKKKRAGIQSEQVEKQAETQERGSILVGQSIAEVLEMDLPPIEQVCGPISTAGVTMLFGAAGTGKSLFTLHMAAHIASGVNLGGDHGWHVPKPRRVLFIDTEMATQYMQGRLVGIPQSDNLRLITLEYLRRQNMEINLGLDSWREAFKSEEFLDQWDVIVFDTVSSNIWPSPDVPSTADQYWLQIEPMHNLMRSLGKSVIWIDNLNKNGDQYGTVAKINKCDQALECLKWEHQRDPEAAGFKINPAGKVRGEKRDMNIAWEMRQLTNTGLKQWFASDP